MADEKKILSEPPPPTDEIDQEWGGTPPPPQAKPAVASAPAPRDDEDEDDEDENDEEETGDEDGEEDEDDDEDDEEEEDDEDEDDAHSARAVGADKSEAKSSSDWLPDWSPWAVLIGLIGLGVAGGLGAFGGAPVPRQAPEPVEAAPLAAAQPDAPEVIEASHLLVSYQGAMRANPSVTRTKEEAKKRAEEALAKAKLGTPFDKLVAEYSDEPNAAARKGALGSFTRDRMVKPFADAAFALKPGQTSGVVETDYGFHVILRTK